MSDIICTADVGFRTDRQRTSDSRGLVNSAALRSLQFVLMSAAAGFSRGDDDVVRSHRGCTAGLSRQPSTVGPRRSRLSMTYPIGTTACTWSMGVVNRSAATGGDVWRSCGRSGTYDGPRQDVIHDAFCARKPMFRSRGVVIAANCCPLNDDSAAMLVMSDHQGRGFGIIPLGRTAATGVSVLSPEDNGPRSCRGGQACNGAIASMVDPPANPRPGTTASLSPGRPRSRG